jgi:hypothetical protein
MSEPFKLATLPFRPGQRLGVMKRAGGKALREGQPA